MATFSSSTYAGYFPDVQSELLAGESLLWCGQPSQRVVFHMQDLFTIPFSLLWGGFAIFWEWMATGHLGHNSHGNAPTFFFGLWGIPFVVIGQYMIWGRFVYTAWKKRRTYYAVTNKRVFVVNTGRTRKVTDAYFQNLSGASLSTRSDGIGTIDFSPVPGTLQNWGMTTNRNWGSQLGVDLSRLAFFDIPDVRNVYQLIQTQREHATKRAD
jgi:hypothetical protein